MSFKNKSSIDLYAICKILIIYCLYRLSSHYLEIEQKLLKMLVYRFGFVMKMAFSRILLLLGHIDDQITKNIYLTQ